MNTIKRYVVVEVLKVFFVTIGIALLIMTLGGGAKEGIRHGLPLDIIVRMIPYFIPEMLTYTLPGCLLFAVCAVFGRMAAANEIVAIKSLGINPLAIVWPVLILSYLMGIFTFGVYDLCAGWARPNLTRTVEESISRIIIGYLKTNGAYAKDGVSIVVKDVQDDRLIYPVIRMDGRNGQPSMTVTAKEATLRYNPELGTLRLEGEDGLVEIAGVSVRHPGRFVRDFELGGKRSESEIPWPPAACRSYDIRRGIWEEKDRIAALERELAMAPGEEVATTNQLKDRMVHHQKRLYRWQAEIPRRFANGLCCMCFALVGMPIAMWRRSADTMSVFFLCFLPILLIFYPLLVVGENLARDGIVPQLSMWLADAVLLVIGGLLLTRVSRR